MQRKAKLSICYPFSDQKLGRSKAKLSTTRRGQNNRVEEQTSKGVLIHMWQTQKQSAICGKSKARYIAHTHIAHRHAHTHTHTHTRIVAHAYASRTHTHTHTYTRTQTHRAHTLRKIKHIIRAYTKKDTLYLGRHCALSHYAPTCRFRNTTVSVLAGAALQCHCLQYSVSSNATFRRSRHPLLFSGPEQQRP